MLYIFSKTHFFICERILVQKKAFLRSLPIFPLFDCKYMDFFLLSKIRRRQVTAQHQAFTEIPSSSFCSFGSFSQEMLLLHILAISTSLYKS